MPTSPTPQDCTHILNLWNSDDNTNRELGVILLSNFEQIPRCMALGLKLMFTYSNRPNLVDTLVSNVFSKEEMQKAEYLGRFFQAVHWTHHWGYEHQYDLDINDFLKYGAPLWQFQQDLEELCVVFPAYRDWVVSPIRILWTHFQTKEAEPFLHYAVQLHPQRSELYFYLGELYLSLGVTNKSIDYFEQYLAIAPQQVPDNDYIIDKHFIEKEYYHASSLTAHTWLGELYLEQLNNAALAQQHWEKAIELAPQHHQSPFLPFAKLIENQQPRRAIELYQQYLEVHTVFYKKHARISPTFAPQHNRIGALAERLEDWNLALSAYKHAKNYEKQIEIVLHYKRDWWQADILCKKLLAQKPQHAQAKIWQVEIRKHLTIK